ncbi:MAG: lysozyme [Bacteroidales bacterium]|nr:lysozyme [Bacteroidales bacterium]
MKTSDYGINLIISFEGLNLKAYWDVNGYAIGYGTHYYPDGTAVKAGDTCTKEQAKEYMLHHIRHEVEPYINNKGLSLRQTQYDALSSFVYNIGCGNWAGSRLLKLLQQVPNPTDDDLRQAFLQYAGGGNYNRRIQEYEHFKKKVL